MLLKINKNFRTTAPAFNMTPVIDIVFLLIVFFVVVFQFIGSDNPPVPLPEGCSFAQSVEDARPCSATVVMRTDNNGRIICLVGADEIQASNRTEMARMLKDALEKNLRGAPESERIVILRIDKNVCYEDAQYILAAAAQSSAAGLRLATLARMDSQKD